MKILILISGGAQIRRNICIVDLYRWLNENNKTTRLLFCRHWMAESAPTSWTGNYKAIVLSDMLSDSIEYKDL